MTTQYTLAVQSSLDNYTYTYYNHPTSKDALDETFKEKVIQCKAQGVLIKETEDMIEWRHTGKVKPHHKRTRTWIVRWRKMICNG